MHYKIGIFEVVVVARATRPQGLRPWCGDETYALGWGAALPQAKVWVKAADHHGASEIISSAATGKYFWTQKVS